MKDRPSLYHATPLARKLIVQSWKSENCGQAMYYTWRRLDSYFSPFFVLTIYSMTELPYECKCLRMYLSIYVCMYEWIVKCASEVLTLLTVNENQMATGR